MYWQFACSGMGWLRPTGKVRMDQIVACRAYEVSPRQ